ncbi:MAG: hypothetical protein K6C08_02600 [Oscillospiraceae bacterium]|nr:hypothetical protein [Oscillospiraceae bacterium]
MTEERKRYLVENAKFAFLDASSGSATEMGISAVRASEEGESRWYYLVDAGGFAGFFSAPQDITECFSVSEENLREPERDVNRYAIDELDGLKLNDSYGYMLAELGEYPHCGAKQLIKTLVALMTWDEEAREALIEQILGHYMDEFDIQLEAEVEDQEERL